MRKARVEERQGRHGDPLFVVVDDKGKPISNHHDSAWAEATAKIETLKLNNPE